MEDLNQLSPAAKSAAMRGGTAGWGQVGSVNHIRYMEPIPPRPGRKRKCHCGCAGPVSHRGMANGVCLITACEWRIRRWVKFGE